MRKPFVLAAISSSLLLLLPFFAYGARGNAVWADESSFVWVHYPKREATSMEPGIREYWVACGQNHYQFTKPLAKIINEAQGYDTSEFLTDDPRWIKWIESDGLAFYDVSSRAYDFSEIPELSEGYISEDIASLALGQSGRAVFNKDGSSSYSVPAMPVSQIIDSAVDLTNFCSSIDGSFSNGYYVLTKNLSSVIASTGTANKDRAFAGVFDGRGHIIDSLSSPNKHLFGYLNGATIKNLSFQNVLAFGVLAETIENSLISDCDFSLSASITAPCGAGFLADSFLDNVKLDNVKLDFGALSAHSSVDNLMGSALARENLSSLSNSVVYSDVSFRGLNSISMYAVDAQNRLLRPGEIAYESTLSLLENSSSSYAVAYLSDSEEAKMAATFFKDIAYKASGVVLPLISISNESVSLHSEPKICFLSSALSSSFGVKLPSTRGSYAILSAGKAILSFANDAMGHQAAVLGLLDKIFGYRYIADGIETFIYQKGSDIPLPSLSLSFSPSFGYRKCDWSDGNDGDMYSFGYNQGYGDYMHYMSAMGNSTFSSGETYHTSLRVLGPVEFYSSHPKWFALNASGNNYGDDYAAWQLCYTAQGDNEEYQSMLAQAATYVQWIYDHKRTSKNQTSFLFGIADNENVCHCSSCEKAISDYGSIAGTVVKFIDDLKGKLAFSAPDLSIGMFAYGGYEEAPIRDGVPSISLSDGTYVLVAPIKANYTYALNDLRNASSQQMFEDWSKIGEVSAWLYDTNFMYYLFPFNSFKANYDNLAYLHEKGVGMVYLQGQHNATQPRTGFNAFKKFLAGKSMMDVSENYAALKREFFASYYGEAGEEMEAFFDEMVAQLEVIESSSDYQSSLYPRGQASIYQDIQNAKFWSWDQLKKWREICDSAYASATNEIAKKHILIESIFPRFATAVLYDYTKWDGLLSSTKKKNLKAFRTSLRDDCLSLGITIFRESAVTMDYYYYGDGGWDLDRPAS